MRKNFFIGCSGYYYPYWKKGFYPEDLPAALWLEYYSLIFNTVELNAPFYRMPRLHALKRYPLVTPPDFKFSVKVNKYITHNLRLNKCRQLILEFEDLISNGLGNKLACLLFQLPPSFHYNEENLERILTQIPHKPQNVVELRHSSWWNPEVEKEFKKAGLTFCNVDFPGVNSYIMHTADLFYFRLHGTPELFKTSYSPERLMNFYKQFPDNCKSHFIYFNNTNGDAAYHNALVLESIIKHA